VAAEAQQDPNPTVDALKWRNRESANVSVK